MSTRRIPAPPFSGDDGRPDERLSAALLAYQTDPARLPDVLAALHRARVLAPVVAVAGDSETNAAGLRVDKTSDIAVPLLEGTDGRRALPVFTCVASLARWDPSARPVPVLGPRAAEVATAEGAEVLVLDPAGPVSAVLAAPELRALVEGRGRTPAYDDEELAGRVAAVLQTEPAVLAAWLLPARDVDARLAVRIAAGTDRPAGTGATGPAGTDDVDEVLLRRLAQRLGDLPGWAAAAVRGLDCALLPAGETPDRQPVFQRFLD